MLAQHIGWPEGGSSLHEFGSVSEGLSIRLADGLSACSAGIADFTAGHYGVDRGAIDVVYTGVDAELFHPEQNGRSSVRPTVLFVGNVSPSKGVETVLEAVLRLRRRRPEIRLEIAGPGDDLLEELKRRV